MSNKIYKINSRKYDGSLLRSWNCRLLIDRHPLLIFQGEFEQDIEHPHLGVIRRGTISTEYFWLDRFYNVFKFETPADDLIGFYCNLNLPPLINVNENELDFVDLDLDIFVTSDFSFQVLDEDEFVENSQKYGYTVEIIEQTENAISELKFMIKTRQFPFDIPS